MVSEFIPRMPFKYKPIYRSFNIGGNMNLFTFSVLSFILFFGCVAGLGLSYDEEQLELSKEDKNIELTESFTSGQRAFLYVGLLSGVASACSSSYLLFSSIGSA